MGGFVFIVWAVKCAGAKNWHQQKQFSTIEDTQWQRAESKEARTNPPNEPEPTLDKLEPPATSQTNQLVPFGRGYDGWKSSNSCFSFFYFLRVLRQILPIVCFLSF